MEDEHVNDADCVPYNNFLMRPEELERLHEVIRLREELDPCRSIPAFPPSRS